MASKDVEAGDVFGAGRDAKMFGMWQGATGGDFGEPYRVWRSIPAATRRAVEELASVTAKQNPTPEALREHLDRAAPAFDRQVDRWKKEAAECRRCVEITDQQRAKAWRAAGQGPYEQEVRAMFRARPESERYGFAMEAAAEGDLTTVQALVGAPSALTGLTAEQRAEIERTYRQVAEPDRLARDETWLAAGAALEDAATAAQRVFSGAVKDAQRAASRVQRAVAAMIGPSAS